jgi:outer membrane lipoprotein-sorting protein
MKFSRCCNSLILLLSLVLAAPGAFAEESAPKSAAHLLKEFSRSKGFSASFKEEKYLTVLNEPLLTEGDVKYTAPDLLVRTTRQPKTRLEIRKSSLSYRDEATKKDLPLDKNHPARAFVQVFLDLIRGDYGSIEKRFTITYTPKGREWEMHLVPRDPKKLAGIKNIDLRGEGLNISWMQIRDRHGDRTETRFEKVRFSLNSSR